MKRIATIDCGTNTLLLLIAEWDGKELRALEDHAEIVRLGEGLDRTGQLSEAAMQRTLAVLERYCERIRATECTIAHAIGTESVRKAENGEDFIAAANRLLTSVGGRFESVSGAREAELAFLAVRASFPRLEPPITVIDIGGGSTEILIGSDTIEEMVSLPIGAVRLHERLLAHDPPTEEERRALERTIDEAVRHSPRPRGTVVGIAGTVTTLAAMVQALPAYDAERVHGATLTGRELSGQIDRLYRLPLAERKQLAGLHPARADVIFAGALILQRLLQHHDCLVSDRGIRWGLAYELAAQN